MTERRCRACGYVGEFGEITTSDGTGYGNLIGRMPRPVGHVGSVGLLVCPSCGSVSCDMRGTIAAPGKEET